MHAFRPSTKYPVLYEVCNATLQRRAIEEVNKWTYNRTRFNAPLPITPLREHLPKLRSGNWSFAAKIDGERFLMTCIRELINGRHERLLLLVNRKLEVLLVPSIALSDGCVGIVIDCELVIRSGEKPVLSAFDCYYSNNPLSAQSQHQRLLALQVILDSHFRLKPTDPVTITSKRFCMLTPGDPETMARLAAMWDAAKSGDREFEGLPCDGIILVDVLAWPKPGMAESQMKMKPHHTIDLTATPDTARDTTTFACLDERNNYTTMFEAAGYHKPGIWECLLQGTDCHPIKPREDKTRPNTLWVIEQTQRTIADAVDIDDLA